MANIQELAHGLDTELETMHRERSAISLVAHSLGGIVARQYVLSVLKSNRPLRIQNLALYAVPNNGASLAAVGKALSWKHSHLAQLCQNSDMLDQINEEWIRLSVEDILRVRYMVGGADQVVTPQSARPSVGLKNFDTLIGHNHRSIIDPENKEDIRYKVLRQFLFKNPPQYIQEKTKHSNNAISPYNADPLFDIYKSKDKPYYVFRDADSFLQKAFLNGHVWLTGPSGAGKTTALRHFILSAGWPLWQITLGSHQGASAVGLLKAVCAEIADAQQSTEPLPEQDSAPDLINFARRQLRSLSAGSVTTLVIEEIPLPIDELPAFVDLMFQLATIIATDESIAGEIKLAFSSIYDPAASSVHPKIRESIQFIAFKFWTEEEMISLVKLINSVECVTVSTQDIEKIALSSGGSPRFVKMLFRNWRNGTADNLNLDMLLSRTKAEQI